MSIKMKLEHKINELKIKVDRTATIKGSITEFDLLKTNKFNRANSGTFRAEFFIYEGTEVSEVLDEFKNTTTEAFRIDQVLVLRDTSSNIYQIYENRDFEKPKTFYNEKALLSYLMPIKSEVKSNITASNIIYFGSPGTGKSHQVNEITKEKNVTQITFHPEYDYHSFVGGFKPTMDGEEIKYKFVPQAFTNIYVEAWKNLVSDEDTKHYYLQIEEINRGNCAEIFGDLFQLLDRDENGYSKYSVKAEEEFKKHLNKEFDGDEYNTISKDELKLPSNLSLIATMNTSDQSLFPMDSAFKRRWDWEYIRINYDCEDSNFQIILDNGKKYSWLEFLKKVNTIILNITRSQDKQLGNWFIDATKTKKIITEKIFKNKVIFYLWNDVFKDEEETIFQSDSISPVTYEHFFTHNDNSILIDEIFEKQLELKAISEPEQQEDLEKATE